MKLKKKIKKALSMFLAVVLMVYNFLPFKFITTVHAEPNDNNEPKISLQLDGATISGNVVTFTVGDTNVSATVSGNGVTFGDKRVEINASEINTLVFAFDNHFDRGTMRLELHDGQQVTVNGDNEAIFGDLDFTNDNAPHLQIVTNNGPVQVGEVNTQNYQGNTSATLNYKVTGDIEYDEEMGTGVGFRINGVTYKIDNQKAEFTEGPAYERDENGQLILDVNNNPMPIKDPETFEPINKKMGVNITGDIIHYDIDGSNKVTITFVTSWNTVIESIKINNNTVDELPQTKEELANSYHNHAIEITVDDISNAETFNIEIEARTASENELYMGNFLWDYNPQGYTSAEDKILNAKLTFVEAEYNGVKYKTEEEINALGEIYNWDDADRKKTYTSERDGVGEAQFPTGTKLTVKIIPDAGYQLVDFGINGGVFDAQDDVGTYTFEIKGGNFHLQATIQQVDDVVRTTSEKIESGSIVLGENEESMVVGSARLDVSDINLTNEQISSFEQAADGYEINNYVDISLYNTVFKGKTTESWDTEVKDLQNEATITLKLEDGVNGNEVVIVHEKHDGTYEVIPVEYDPQTNTISFKTKSFSNYAIATKADNVNKNVSNTVNNPQTNDNIGLYITMLGLSALGLSLVGLYSKKNLLGK